MSAGRFSWGRLLFATSQTENAKWELAGRRSVSGSMVAISPITHERRLAAVYAWSGYAVMWGFWVSFVIFLAEPRALMSWWPFPTIDRAGAATRSLVAAIADLGL